MNIDLLNQIFSWSAIVLTVLAAIASAGSLITGNFISSRKDSQIERLKPRSISAQQRNDLLQRVSGSKGKIGFVTRLMDGEGADFAEQIAAVFRAADWDVVPTLRTSLNDFPGFVSLFVTGPNLDSTADLICQSFNDVGIECKKAEIKENTIGSQRQPDTVYIVVGRKL